MGQVIRLSNIGQGQKMMMLQSLSSLRGQMPGWRIVGV